MKRAHLSILTLCFFVLWSIPVPAQTPVNIRGVGNTTIGTSVPVTITGASTLTGICPTTTLCKVDIAAVGGTNVTAVPAVITDGVALTIYAGTLSTIADLTTTTGGPAANITTNTITISALHCFNRTSSAATVSRAQSDGTVFQSAFSIPANSDVYLVSPGALEKQVGLALWAGTNSAIRCVMSARQP